MNDVVVCDTAVVFMLDSQNLILRDKKEEVEICVTL